MFLLLFLRRVCCLVPAFGRFLLQFPVVFFCCCSVWFIFSAKLLLLFLLSMSQLLFFFSIASVDPCPLLHIIDKFAHTPPRGPLLRYFLWPSQSPRGSRRPCAGARPDFAATLPHQGKRRDHRWPLGGLRQQPRRLDSRAKVHDNRPKVDRRLGREVPPSMLTSASSTPFSVFIV